MQNDFKEEKVMQKFKKITALALAMVMVVGGSMTAFAEEPATEGSLTGTGSSEGTVDKHIIKVVLPTVESDSEMFNFTIDSERLLQETEHERLGDDVIFPESSSDTGVYFITDVVSASATPVANSYSPSALII